MEPSIVTTGRRPNAYRYLAAIAAICQHGLTSGTEVEAIASVKAIAQDAPHWLAKHYSCEEVNSSTLTQPRRSAM